MNVAIFSVISCFFICFVGCQKKTPPERANVEQSKPPVAVRIADVQLKKTPRKVEIDAPLSGIRQIDVFSKSLGRITYLGPKEGAAVKQGELLFRLDRSDPGESFLNMPTLSPMSGWVGMWHVTNIGEQVTPETPVVTIVDDRSLKAVAFLPSDDWMDVTLDSAVTAELNHQSREARIISVARSADQSSGRGSVTVEIPNPSRDWRSGMFVRLKFALQPKNRLLVSTAALIITDQGTFVYLTEGESARKVRVNYRIVDADTVEITDGLPDSARVVIAGANLLSDKSRVKVIE